MASRSTNTLAELLQRWSSDAGQAMLTLPEDDASTLAQLVATFRQLLSDKATAAVQQQAAATQGGGSAAPPPGMGAPDGVMPGMGSPPPPDELRRMIPGMQ
jgi:hypothetical protein